tara:strand:- start:180 stop:380 length:201 start_codon:yes stop_codon:yes gene_type:complete
MDKHKEPIIAWASLRAIHLYNSNRYEDSYAVSQEFLEWTSSYIVHSGGPTISILRVPKFNKENRTS